MNIDRLSNIDLEKLLNQLGWEDHVETSESAGEGNMNIVRRIQSPARSYILKQSVPYVNKYPDIPAPVERIESEWAFYKAISIDPAIPVPLVEDFNTEHHLIRMEDLGAGRDLTSLYNTRAINTELHARLTSVLSKIHQCEVPGNYPDNLALRQLNHQHIFVLPYIDNGFDLDTIQPGLQQLANDFNTTSYPVITTIGEKYLAEGDTLLHGDYFPGSWLETDNGVFIIDPEFTFGGFREFDLGVMAAHLVLITSDSSIIATTIEYYNGDVDATLVSQVAAIEIARRLIGLAQLPLERSIDEKKELLDLAANLLT